MGVGEAALWLVAIVVAFVAGVVWEAAKCHREHEEG